jgi:hypothetical protein
VFNIPVEYPILFVHEVPDGLVQVYGSGHDQFHASVKGRVVRKLRD